MFAGAQGGRGKGSEGKVLKEEKVLKIDRPFRAGGFLSLTGPLGPRVVVAASPQIFKKGARLAPQVVQKGCGKRFLRLMGPFGPKGS